MIQRLRLVQVLVIALAVLIIPGKATQAAGDTRGPAAVWNDAASPSIADSLSMFIDLYSFAAAMDRINKINAMRDQFPMNCPMVMEVRLIRDEAPSLKITYFRIQKAWAGRTDIRIKDPGLKFFDGLVYISTTGTGPRFPDFPGLKISLSPQSQSADLCGVVHFSLTGQFRAAGSIHRVTVPGQYVKWGNTTFDALRLEDPRTAEYGGFVAGNKTGLGGNYTFYPAREGSHTIFVHVGKHTRTAVVNILPARPERLELIPGPGSGSAPAARAMLHFKGDCIPAKDVTAQVKWSIDKKKEPVPEDLTISAPSNVALCDTVPLKAFLRFGPGYTAVTAAYEGLTASTAISDPSGMKTLDVTLRPGLVWSTGGPEFRADAEGTVTITVQDSGSSLSAARTLRVVPPAGLPLYPLAAVSVPAKMKAGQQASLSATAFHCSGNRPAAGVKWVSLTPGLLSCTPSGGCRALKAGDATVGLMKDGRYLVKRTIAVEPSSAAAAPAKDSPGRQADSSDKRIMDQGSKDRISEDRDSEKPVKKPEVQVWRKLDNKAFVESLYQSILDRASDPGGFRHWMSRLKNGGSRESVLSYFFKSPEYQSRKKSHAEFIRDLYQALYGREPSAAELKAALGRLEGGLSRSQLVNAAMSPPPTGKGLSASAAGEKKKERPDRIPAAFHGLWKVKMNLSGAVRNRLWEIGSKEVFSKSSYTLVGFVKSVQGNTIRVENPNNKATITFSTNSFTAFGSLKGKGFSATGTR